jgi:hypothetical protein
MTDKKDKKSIFGSYFEDLKFDRKWLKTLYGPKFNTPKECSKPYFYCEKCHEKTSAPDALLNSDKVLLQSDYKCCDQPLLVKIQTCGGPSITEQRYLLKPKFHQVSPTYGPHNMGPLHFAVQTLETSVASTFRTETYFMATPPPDGFTFLFRDQSSSDVSHFGSFYHFDYKLLGDPSHPFHSLRHDYSIPQEWNEMMWRSVILVPHGGEMWIGKAAPQKITLSKEAQQRQHHDWSLQKYPIHVIDTFLGGGQQVWLNRTAAFYFHQATQHLARMVWATDKFWDEEQRKYFMDFGGDLGLKAQEQFHAEVAKVYLPHKAQKDLELEMEKSLLKIENAYFNFMKKYKSSNRETISTKLKDFILPLKELIQTMKEKHVKWSVLWHRAVKFHNTIVVVYLENKEKLDQEIEDTEKGQEPYWKRICETKTHSCILDGTNFKGLPNIMKQILLTANREISWDKKTAPIVPSGWYKVHEEEVDGLNRILSISIYFSHTSHKPPNTTTYHYIVKYKWT